ncbi:hydroxyproline dehydrogenase-like [Hetaerina americana]|uniref:hydroxyproline dehydrogenase-like n=1 Tax=Hetaerina americana TaxID=62018 RepID=UPI003A7F48B0
MRPDPRVPTLLGAVWARLRRPPARGAPQATSSSAEGVRPSSRLEFDDHRAVFRHKSTWELLRGLLVLRVCGADAVAANALKIFRLGHRLLGERVLGWLLRPTVYAQFVAAGGRRDGTPPTEREDLEAAAASLETLGLRLMVAPTLEGDVGEGGRDDLYNRNLQELLQLAEWAWEFGGGGCQRKPCLQVKATALLSADVLKILARHYDESCELEKIKLVNTLAATALTTSETTVASCGIAALSQDLNEAIYKGVRRLGHLGAAAQRRGMTLLLDAEYSYVNGAVSLLALAAMSVYNKDLPIVCNTIQCYFKEAKSNLERELKIAEHLGLCYGAKIVRGAYLEQERSIELKNGPSLTCSSHEETGQNYNQVVSRFLMHAAGKPASRCLVIIATHNEAAICYAIDALHALGLSPLSGPVAFAQIYGMAEQISMPLVRGGYVVYKSVPAGGRLWQVLPYLARRAAENRSVLRGARRERELLQQELLWRLRGRWRVVPG